MGADHRVRASVRGLVSAVVLAIGLVLTVGAAASYADDDLPGTSRRNGPDSFANEDTFAAGIEPYTGNFADPTVLRVGDTWYAYSTGTARRYLPVLTSTDLLSWRTHESWSGDPLDNDALAAPASWARYRDVDGAPLARAWAPTVAHIGRRYVELYATSPDTDRRQTCLTVTTATSPLGPFVDRSRGPLVCPAHGRAIDPWIWSSPGGRHWLVWKTKGLRRHSTNRLMVRELSRRGTSFRRGSAPEELLRNDPSSWEGLTVENPSFIGYRGRFYLFYSGSSWTTESYATGYAVCRRVTGPCRKVDGPLIAGAGGPGGASAFVDTDGALRLIYHRWSEDPTSPTAQRRMHVARLGVDAGSGLLSVLDEG